MADGTTPAPTLSQHQQRAIDLHNKLWNDAGPRGRAYREQVKEDYPDVKTPEDAAEVGLAPMREALAKANERIAAMEKANSERETRETERQLQGDLEARLNAARDKYRLDADGFDKMVARMKETSNFGDADAAALWVMAQNPPPANERGRGPEPAWLDKKLNLFGSAEHDERMTKLHTDPQGFMDDGLRDFARDPDAYVAEDQRLIPLGQI